MSRSLAEQARDLFLYYWSLDDDIPKEPPGTKHFVLDEQTMIYRRPSYPMQHMEFHADGTVTTSYYEPPKPRPPSEVSAAELQLNQALHKPQLFL